MKNPPIDDDKFHHNKNEEEEEEEEKDYNHQTDRLGPTTDDHADSQSQHRQHTQQHSKGGLDSCLTGPSLHSKKKNTVTTPPQSQTVEKEAATRMDHNSCRSFQHSRGHSEPETKTCSNNNANAAGSSVATQDSVRPSSGTNRTTTTTAASISPSPNTTRTVRPGAVHYSLWTGRQGERRHPISPTLFRTRSASSSSLLSRWLEEAGTAPTDSGIGHKQSNHANLEGGTHPQTTEHDGSWPDAPMNPTPPITVHHPTMRPSESPSSTTTPSVAPSRSLTPSIRPTRYQSEIEVLLRTKYAHVFTVDKQQLEQEALAANALESLYWIRALRFVEQTSVDTMEEWRIVQRYALACLYHATNGVATPFYLNQTQQNSNGTEPVGQQNAYVIVEWNRQWADKASSDNECHWGGIRCSEYPARDSRFHKYGPVERVDLPGRGVTSKGITLTGSLPLELILLHDSLTRLSLAGNMFWNQGPSHVEFLGQLTKLTHLDLSRNAGLVYDEGIPTQFAALTNLEHLDLSYIFPVHWTPMRWKFSNRGPQTFPSYCSTDLTD